MVDWDGEASAVEFLDSADRALRAAKRSGGGRVAGASTEHRSDGLLELTKNLVRTRRAD